MTAPGGDPGRNPYGPDEPGGRVPGGLPQPGPPGYQPGPPGYPPPGYPNPGGMGPVHPGYGYGPAPQTGTNTMAVASLVTSMVGITPYCGGILSIVGIVLGAVALNQIKQTPQDGYGLAVAGIVVGVATLIIGLIWTIYAMR